MFGLSAFSLKVFFFSVVFLAGSVVRAQAQQATVINSGALVYRDADFDAPIIATLKIGAVYSISTGKKGPFYKIRLKPGSTGWVADTDMKPGVHKYEPPPTMEEFKAKVEAEKPAKPYFASRFRGASINLLNYTEDTLGEKRSAMTPFFGLNFHGYNTVMDGDIYIDSNLMVALSAPSYYKDYTGKEAQGSIFIADFLFQTVLPQSKATLFFYGFGPMLKYSSLVITAPSGAGTVAYPADDMTIGAVFNLGYSARFGKFSFKPDIKYYWEKSAYFGFSLNVGYLF